MDASLSLFVKQIENFPKIVHLIVIKLRAIFRLFCRSLVKFLQLLLQVTRKRIVRNSRSLHLLHWCFLSPVVFEL